LVEACSLSLLLSKSSAILLYHDGIGNTGVDPCGLRRGMT
jgi:hypothetical protein